MYESQHRINTSKNMARYKQVVRPHRSLQLVTVSKKVYFGVKTIASPPFKASRGLFIEWRWRHNYIARMYFNLWNISKGESFSSCTRPDATGDISLCLCMPQNKSCHFVKQGYRVLGKSFYDSSCLQNSLPTWLWPSLALWQCCQVAVVHGMGKKMTGSFNFFVLQRNSKW